SRVIEGEDVHPAVRTSSSRVNLVALDRRTGRLAERATREHGAANVARRLAPRKRRHGGPQAAALDDVHVRLDLIRTLDTLAEHLVPTADPDHDATIEGGIRDGGVEATLAQPREVGDRRLAAGQDDDVGHVDRLRPRHEAHRDARLGSEWLEIVEVRD